VPLKKVASSAEVLRFVPNRVHGPGASAMPGVRSKLVAQGSTEPARVTPIVSMIAVLESSIACLVTFLSPNERMRSARR